MSPDGDSYDVVIAGYGPVGQFAAALLGQLGHRVAVFERRAERYPLPRAVHYDHEIARAFQAIGVSDELAGIVEPATTYEWRNAAGETLMRFDWSGPGLCGWPQATMFSQPELEAVLDGAARRRPSVEVHRGWELAGLEDGAEHVEVTVRSGDDRRLATARYVIGCDGANSTVRALLGVGEQDLGFVFDWLIADTRPHDPALLAGVNRQICDPLRPTTVVSGGPGRRRWEWMLLPGEKREDVEHEDFVRTQLEQSGISAADIELERHVVYTFRARWADTWRAGRVLLAGDAAHLMPPFAGQGMCSGIRDVMTLAWQLDLVLSGAAPDALLDNYTVERQAHLQHAITLSVELGKVICVTDEAVAAARDELLLAAASNPDLAPPPPPEPRLGPGVIGDGPTAGTLFPQGHVRVGEAEGRFDDAVGRGFVLYLAGVAAEGVLSDSDLAALRGVGGQAVTVDEAMDLDGVYRSWLRAHDAAAVLVRPDHYVFDAVAAAGDAPRLVQQLRATIDRPGGHG
jgi:2-polyprenyl-6-methoxyphenol hydroxylase-like FAD-dependent oxidoreductase